MNAPADRYATPEYRRSRAAYQAQCAFEYFVALLVSDAYLAKLLTDIGLSDTLIGVISSFVGAAFLFQLGSLFAVQRIRNTKRTVTIFSTMSQFLFIGLYLIPFLPFSLPVKTVLVVAVILLAYFCNYFVTSMLFKWCNSFVNPNLRGSYSAGKEMISLIGGMVFTFVVGLIIDRYEGIGNLHGGFLFITCAGFILSICNLTCLLLVAKEPKGDVSERVPMRQVFRGTLGNRNFVNVIIMTSLWSAARYASVGFMGTFKTKDLLLSVGTVQIINIVANLFRFFASKPLGRYSDRTSYARGIELAFWIAAAGFLINVFTTPASWFCVVLYTIMYNVSFAGTSQNGINIVYSYVDSRYFVQANALMNSISGALGFAVSLGASRILGYVQAHGNRLFGVQVYGQQLLSALSLLIMIVSIIFVHTVIARQKVMKQ